MKIGDWEICEPSGEMVDLLPAALISETIARQDLCERSLTGSGGAWSLYEVTEIHDLGSVSEIVVYAEYGEEFPP